MSDAGDRRTRDRGARACASPTASCEAVRGIDFDVARGEVFGLLGPNGAGKTTTVEILEGYRERSGGDVTVLGFDPGARPRALRERVGIVLQQTRHLPPPDRARGAGALGRALPAPRDVDEAIDAGRPRGEAADARTRTLSGGQLRRLDLALALIGDPELSSSTSRRPASTRRRAAGVGHDPLAAATRQDGRC